MNNNFLSIFRDSEIYIKYYMNIFQTMVLGVIPFCALIFFNIKIYHRFMLTRGRFQGGSNRGSTQVCMTSPLISKYVSLTNTMRS